MKIFKKGIYWHDYVEKDVEQFDLAIQVLNPLIIEEIFFENPIECREFPSCLEEDFEVLFFDWGGMSLGNSLMEHFCSYIHKHAEEHPNRFYIMVSSFTSEAMKEAIEEFGKEKPFNLFLCIKDFAFWVKKNYEEKNK